MNQRLAVFVCICATVWIPKLFAQGASPDETISFKYAPPENTRFVQRIEMTRKKTYEGIGSQLDQSVSETLLTIGQEGDDFVMVARPLFLEMTRDGEPMTDPLAELLNDVILTYRISTEGEIEELEGFDILLERATTKLTPELVQELAAGLDEEAMIRREEVEWNGRIGDFAGKTFSMGEVLEGEVAFTLPTGENIVYQTRTWFPGYEPCGAGRCARVELRYDSDAEAFEETISRSVGAIVEDDGAGSSSGGPRIVGAASRVIDPATMLIHSETLTRKISMTLEIPGKGTVLGDIREEKNYTFRYGNEEGSMP